MSKLMVLGGANVHVKLIKAAKSEKCTTIVAEYLSNSPAKKLADTAYLMDIKDTDKLEAICRNEHVNAVLSTHLDPCQRPYQQLCEKLRLPCFCNANQVFKMTDKREFKNAVETIMLK